jgi:tRNA threonylcarbamoyladenosine biosynthesis protein TsaB
MKNLLVIDTATERAAVGLVTLAGRVHSLATAPARRHGRDLIPQIAAILSESGLVAADVDVIGVGLGPGSYTGLRVGVTAAKTLAYATGASLLGLDSLHAIALNAAADALHVSVIADAQRDDIYVADYSRPCEGAPLAAARASRIEPLTEWLKQLEPDVLVLGPGLGSARIRAALPPSCRLANPGLNFPDGRCLIELARAAFDTGRRENPWLLEPLYLRKSAAEEKWDARQADSSPPTPPLAAPEPP